MNVSIKDAVNNAQTFAELAPVVRQAKEGISFFGIRYITAIGYKGSLGINDLAIRVMAIREENLEFDENEQEIRRELAEIVTRLYSSNNERSTYNPITYIFCKIFDAWEICSVILYRNDKGPRYTWEIEAEKLFDDYTFQQYRQTFGKDPVDLYSCADTRVKYWGKV